MCGGRNTQKLLLGKKGRRGKVRGHFHTAVVAAAVAVVIVVVEVEVVVVVVVCNKAFVVARGEGCRWGALAATDVHYVEDQHSAHSGSCIFC